MVCEAFRDTLIDVQNKGFPIESPAGASGTVEPTLRNGQLREFVLTADQHLRGLETTESSRSVTSGIDAVAHLIKDIDVKEVR
jgi:hypothetical protein